MVTKDNALVKLSTLVGSFAQSCSNNNINNNNRNSETLPFYYTRNFMGIFYSVELEKNIIHELMNRIAKHRNNGSSANQKQIKHQLFVNDCLHQAV